MAQVMPAPRGLLRALLSIVLIIVAIVGTCCSGEYGPDQCGGEKGKANLFCCNLLQLVSVFDFFFNRKFGLTWFCALRKFLKSATKFVAYMKFWKRVISPWGCFLFLAKQLFF
jgi:hypothetical protein